jgi:hypothetical protein
VNVIAAYSLINGTGPAPNLDVLGSGLGFTISSAVGCVLVLGVLMSGTGALSWLPTDALDGELARRVLNVGVPAGLEQLQFNIAFMIYTAIIASLGTTALAAHGDWRSGLTFHTVDQRRGAALGQSLGARPDWPAEKARTDDNYYLQSRSPVMLLFGEQI